MESIAPGVHLVPSYSNAFIIDGDAGVTLIDTGMPRRHGAMLDALAALGRARGDVTAIAVTHSHVDHVGNAAVLKRETGAPVFASAVDAPAVRGDEPAPAPLFLDRVRFLKPIYRLMPGAEGVEVDHLIGEGKSTGLPEDLTVIDTPGHTPGHVSFLLDRQGGVLFVGDAAVRTKAGEIKRGWMNRSTPTFDASLRHLAGFDFEVAVFAHSAPLVGSAAAAFKRFAASIG
ncbi:MAG: MBL fold metallo-hydrolase [Acidimicrobiia bacterium]|nr:MBL fold metallo-hydrolase [Acidimicrobiia bacterium]